jgi:Bacterial membrane protein YfhO
MGITVIKDIGRGSLPQPRRLGLFAIFLVVYAVNGCSYQPGTVKIYFAAAMIISLAALALLILARHNMLARRMAMAAFICLILTDMAISAWSMKHYVATYYNVRPHFLEDFPAQAGAVELDFHNPRIFPFVGQTDMDGGQPYLWTLPDISLNFNGVINRQLTFAPTDVHNPKHISFGGWQDDPVMKDYVSKNSKLFFFARYAVQKGPGIFENIVSRNLAQDVLMVDGRGPSIRTEIPKDPVPLASGNDQWYSISKEINDSWPGWVYKNDMAIWDFPADINIPPYFASNIFTHDRWVRFFIQTADQKFIELAPAQGELLRPMTFDVQNIKEGKVFVALPANTSFVGMNGMLLLKTRDASGITSVWLHHSDETGINFLAPADGWLGIQYPYDPKWRIDVDGKPVHFYRVNKSFIGLPVAQGEHKVLIRYWPDSWLRWGLPASVVLTLALFVTLIIYALFEASYE